MAGELLSQFYKTYFEQIQPEIKRQIVQNQLKEQELFNKTENQEIT